MKNSMGFKPCYCITLFRKYKLNFAEAGLQSHTLTTLRFLSVKKYLEQAFLTWSPWVDSHSLTNSLKNYFQQNSFY